MRCPTLRELPSPRPDKTGWPWTEETQLPDHVLGSRHWPRVTIVTPSYNQAEFLEETIRSLLLQGYPELELIVMDGGSTDASIEKIKKYEEWIHFWRSRSDDGQSSAINEGLRIATGEIFNWINSDDLLLPGALFRVAEILKPKEPAWLIGAAEAIDRNGVLLSERTCSRVDLVSTLRWGSSWFPQPSTFWTRALWDLTGPLDESLGLVMDMDLWIRMMQTIEPIITSSPLSRYRKHPAAKCSTQKSRAVSEMLRVRGTYLLDSKITDVERTRLVRQHLRQAKSHFSGMLSTREGREAANTLGTTVDFLIRLIRRRMRG